MATANLSLKTFLEVCWFFKAQLAAALSLSHTSLSMQICAQRRAEGKTVCLLSLDPLHFVNSHSNFALGLFVRNQSLENEVSKDGAAWGYSLSLAWSETEHADVARSQLCLELKESPTVWIQLKFQLKTPTFLCKNESKTLAGHSVKLWIEKI